MSNVDMERLDRHALVMAIWMSFGFVALVLFRYAFISGTWIAVLSAFAAVLLAFAGHVIVNSVTGTYFTQREVALGLVAYMLSAVAFALATFLSPDFRSAHFLSFGLGLIAVAAGVVFYMVTHFGLRRAFGSFDVIRRFRD